MLQHPFLSLTRDFTIRLQADLFVHSKNALNLAQEVSLLTTALGMLQWSHGITAQPTCALPQMEPFSLVVRPVVAVAVLQARPRTVACRGMLSRIFVRVLGE